MDAWLELAKLTGPVATMLAFFVWRDWASSRELTRREKALGIRLDAMIDNHNRVTETTILNNTQALNGVKESNRELKEEIRNACKFNNANYHRNS